MENRKVRLNQHTKSSGTGRTHVSTGGCRYAECVPESVPL